MKRIAKLAVAATILVALGIPVFWMTIGGTSANIALASVADALDSLRSATFDIEIRSEAEGDTGQPPATATGKGFFLAPSHQRIETTVDVAERTVNMGGQQVTIPKCTINQVMIVDGQEAKCTMLQPAAKLAIMMDMKKAWEDMKKSGQGVPPDVFEMVRRLVREGSSGTGEKDERLPKKEIEGREAVGFRTRANGNDMILWADPETARPIRIEIAADVMAKVDMVMHNFRYDVELDPSLFSLEPPAGYSTQTINMTMPVEQDLLNTLRIIAEHNKGLFPARLGMNEEVMRSLMAGIEPRTTIDKPTQDRLEAEMKKILAKYGGEKELKKKYGKDKRLPPEITDELTKARMPLFQEQMQGQMQKQMQDRLPLIQERTQGITFYTMLKTGNDPHYVGGGVKLGTPNRPILWYKPTGAEKYRVIYADLSVQEMTPDDVKKLPEAASE